LATPKIDQKQILYKKKKQHKRNEREIDSDNMNNYKKVTIITKNNEQTHSIEMQVWRQRGLPSWRLFGPALVAQ
jgi:hypothetical protein